MPAGLRIRRTGGSSNGSAHFGGSESSVVRRQPTFAFTAPSEREGGGQQVTNPQITSHPPDRDWRRVGGPATDPAGSPQQLRLLCSQQIPYCGERRDPRKEALGLFSGSVPGWHSPAQINRVWSKEP